MIQHSKHVFTIIIVIVLSALALFFWATARNVGENQTTSSWKTYRDEAGAFVLSFPGDMVSSEESQVFGNPVILFQTGATNRWFSLETRAFSSFESLTLENMQAYISLEDIHEPEEVSVDEARGIAFRSADGETRFVWFSYAGTLYQIEAPRDFERTLSLILGTWQFSL